MYRFLAAGGYHVDIEALKRTLPGGRVAELRRLGHGGVGSPTRLGGSDGIASNLDPASAF